MAKGFKDSKGNFRPTGNDKRLSSTDLGVTNDDKKQILNFLKRQPDSISDNFSESLDVDTDELERNLHQLVKEGKITENDVGKNEEFPIFNLKSKDDDEPILEQAELNSILQEVGDIDTGEIDFNKLDKVVEESVKEILEREKILKEGNNISVHLQDTREETGQNEFKKTGKGESGFYQYFVNVYSKGFRVEDIIFRGVAYGSISAGDVTDMEVDLFR